MTAGLNLKVNIWRFTFANDAVGGAMPSGTVLYTGAEARISPLKPTLALLEQGLETPTLFTAVIAPTYLSAGTFVLNQNYQVEVTSPPISEYYNKKFVIIGVQPAAQNDPRKYWLVTLRREVIANQNNLQT